MKSFVKSPVWDFTMTGGGKKHVGVRDNPVLLEAENYSWTAYNGNLVFWELSLSYKSSHGCLKGMVSCFWNVTWKDAWWKIYTFQKIFTEGCEEYHFQESGKLCVFVISFIIIGKDMFCLWPRIDVVSKWGKIMTSSFILF